MAQPAEMAVRCEVLRRRLKKWAGSLLAGFLALFLTAPIAYADNWAPAGWDVQLNSYTRGPDYVRVTVTVPTDAVQVNTYMYEHSYDTQPYTVQHRPVTPDANGQCTFFIYNMLGGGYPTYIRMTYVDSNGNESPLPANMFILQLDVAVYLDGISPDTLAKLQDALNNLEGRTGVGQVIGAGQALQNALSGITGFSGAGSGDLAFTVPIVHPSDFGLSLPNVDVTLMSQDQLSRLTWLSTVRTIIEAAIWITFVVYLVARFAPMFKV
jgi:hypothetical protein